MSETSMESKLLAEAIGVFALTFIGAGSIIMGGDLLTVAIAHGVVLSIVVSATMNISGGHINPAVTVAFVVVKRMDSNTGLKYVIAQLVGGIIAGMALYLITDLSGYTFPALGGLGTPAPGAGIGAAGVLVVELMFAIWGTAVDTRAPAIAGWGIGMMVCVDILMGGPLTGAAMNPARHLGTALFAGKNYLADVWMYVIGPLAGALACSYLYEGYIMPQEGSEEEGSEEEDSEVDKRVIAAVALLNSAIGRGEE